ncbi:MAG: DegV family protein [Solobacterium sp.]|nr:DegV family protein [Solobacterium sp.]
MKRRIVSDSSSNILERNSDVEYCTTPLKILIDGKEYPDVPGLDMVDLVARIELSEKNSTSCPSISEWTDAFEGADEIFGVTISSNLSGSYNSAMNAAEMYLEDHPDVKIHIFDSLATGGTMELLIEKIEECIRAEMSFEDIIKAVDEYHEKDKILFSLESVKNLAKNGRMLKALADLANALGIRFIGKASERGTIQQAHIARGQKKALITVYNEMLKMGYQGGKVRINHCLNVDAAGKLKDMILQQFPSADVKVCLTTALCSYYAERGGMIIGFEVV